MKKLLKVYGFTTYGEYWQMCIDSYINGQISQAKNQFSKMPKQVKKDMITWVKMNETDEIFNFFFKQL